jgi:hypothetical protein
MGSPLTLQPLLAGRVLSPYTSVNGSCACTHSSVCSTIVPHCPAPSMWPASLQSTGNDDREPVAVSGGLVRLTHVLPTGEAVVETKESIAEMLASLDRLVCVVQRWIVGIWHTLGNPRHVAGILVDSAPSLPSLALPWYPICPGCRPLSFFLLCLWVEIGMKLLVVVVVSLTVWWWMFVREPCCYSVLFLLAARLLAHDRC